MPVKSLKDWLILKGSGLFTCALVFNYYLQHTFTKTMYRLSYFLFLLAFVQGKNLPAQTDSLQKVYQQATSFEQKLEAGNELIMALRFNHKAEAKKTALHLLNDKRIERYPEAHARAWIRLGIVYDLSNRADSAIFCNEKALAIASNKKLPKQKASALNNLGLIYWNYNQLDKATDYITKASTEFEKNKDTSNLANALNNLGLIMNELSFRKKAGDYHHKALTLFTLVNDEYGKGSALHNLAFSQTSFDSAKYYYYKTVACQQAIHDDYGLGKTYNNIAIMYGGQVDSAMRYYTLAIEYQRKAGNLYGQASTLGTMASYVLTNFKQTDKALEYALESEKIVKSIGYVKYLWKIEGIIGKIYATQGNYKQAAFHLREALNAKDSVMQEEIFNTSQQLELKYNVAQKEKKLAETEAKNARQDQVIAEKELEKQNILMILVMIVFIAVFSLLVLGWWLNRKRLKGEKQHAQLLADEREKSLQRTLMGQEEERQRIAKDLHDGIVQELAALKMNLEQMSSSLPVDEAKKLEQVKNNLEKTTSEVRDISHQMMPTSLRKLGLVAALEDNLQKILPLHHITYDFFSHGVEERLPEKIEISLYRISQELVNNIIKHSKASQVSISLTKRNGIVTMHVEDNGKGFDPAVRSNGIGLTNLESRVKMVDGEIKYETGENAGVVAIVRIPL